MFFTTDLTTMKSDEISTVKLGRNMVSVDRRFTRSIKEPVKLCPNKSASLH